MADEARRQVEAVYAEFQRLILSGQTGKLIDLYTEDAIMMPHQGNVISGKKNIKPFVDSHMVKLGEMKVEKVIYFELLNDNLAYVNDYSHSKDKEGKILGYFQSAIIWKRVNGKWLVHKDSFNSRPDPVQSGSTIPEARTVGADWKPAPSGSEVKARAEIEARLKQIYKDNNEKKYDDLVKVYTEDIVVFADQSPYIEGRAVVRGSLDEAMANVTELSIEKITYFELVNATTALTSSDSKCVDLTDGVYLYRDLLLWRKIGGQWYVQREMSNERPSK